MEAIFGGLRIIAWTISVFFYYFQVPFIEYAGFITAGIAAFMILDIRHIFSIFKYPKIGLLYMAVFSFCCLNLLYSVSSGTDLSSAFRFFLIVVLLPLCPLFITKESRFLYKIFSVLSVSKAIMLIVISLLIIIAGSYSEMRLWARLNNYGDVYFAYQFIPRVQLKGNALLLIAFMISFCKTRKFNVYNSILLIGIFCAGNFAFLLGLGIFFVWMYIRSLKYSTIGMKKIFIGGTLFLVALGFFSYASLEANSKSGDFGSNGLRLIQYEILTDTNVLYGRGLGSVVLGASRLGRSIDEQYYELQTLYIYYQVGAMCLIALYILILYVMKKSCNSDGFIIFLIYLIYSFFNPYCFDTTQIITMMLLSFEFSRNKNKD